jgi:hypothetical protein
MKASRAVTVLSLLIVTLSLIAAAVGVFWQGDGSSFEFKTLRGEVVTIHGRGLYKFDSVSIAAQAIAQDIVTLSIGIPLFVVSLVLCRKGFLRGQLLLSGTLGYFLYTYTSLAFLAAYNSFFLVYTALFSMSLFAFILSLRAIEVSELPSRFSEKLPRRFISVFSLFIGTVLLLLWLGRIVPALVNESIPFGLESYTTLVIQALDLGIIVPLTFLSGIMLLKRKPWGYLLSSIVVIKGLTMLAALTAMIIGELLVGAQLNPIEIVFFPTFALINVVVAFLLLKNISERTPH